MKLLDILRKLGLIRENGIFYIGGSAVLPMKFATPQPRVPLILSLRLLPRNLPLQTFRLTLFPVE